MRSYFKLTLTSAVTLTLITINTAWAINPDGTSGSRSSGAISQPLVSAPATRPATSGKPILTNPSTEDIKKALGIGQPQTKDVAGLKAEGFGSMIEFETNSDVVIPSGGLNKILAALLDLEPTASIEIVGHTDNQGGAAYNMNLSQRRAEAVRRWFEANGVRPGAIRARGAGLHEPIASNATEAGRRQNRRVEFSRLYE
jgi:outer membrane protein OmpA-like peptidoglycan-associated protein